MRIASQLHDETVFEVKTGASGQGGADAALKQLMAYATMFGTTFGKTHDDMLNAMRVNYTPGGAHQSVGRIMRQHMLNDSEKAWSRALQDVMGVTCSFYITSDAAARRAIEQRYADMAKRNPRKGHKAAVARKVLVARVKYVLEDEPAGWLPDDDRTPSKMSRILTQQGSVTGRMSGGPKIFSNLPKSLLDSKIVGTKANRFIVDELTQFRKP